MRARSHYSARLFRAFGRYVGWSLRRQFHGVRLSLRGVPRVPAQRPLIVYSNHPSWWDPAVFVFLCTRLFPGRNGFGPMDAAALARYPVLERIGVFGIETHGARGGARFLKESCRLLETPGNILWITAEAAFTDARRRPVRLRPGLAHLTRRVPQAIVIPLALEYTFWNESRPEVLCRFGAPLEASGVDIAATTARFEAALAHTLDELQVESLQRDPQLFRSLLAGGAGIGGIYDTWRRLRSWSRGRRFDPTHEGTE